MTLAQQDSSPLRYVGRALISCCLAVFGVFEMTTAYGSRSSWLLGGAALAGGVAGFVWVVLTERRYRGRALPPLWLVMLAGITLITVAVLWTVGTVCGDESGFSCGG